MAPDREFNSLKSHTLFAAKKRQSGVTFLGLLVFVLISIFGFILAAQLVPVYMEGYSVGQTLNSLKGETRENISSEEKLRIVLMRRLGINEVRNVKNQNITVKYQAGKTLVRISYEVRSSLVANTDIVTHFDKSVEIVH